MVTDSVDDSHAYAAAIRPVIDQVYTELRSAGTPPSRAIAEQYGLTRADLGVLYDVYFGVLARPLTVLALNAVRRYDDPEDLAASVQLTAAAGLIRKDLTLTDRGRRVLEEIEAAIADGAEAHWGTATDVLANLNGLLAKLLSAGTAGPAFSAVSPPHEPDEASAALLFCNRLGALRHHRADAHAAAFAAAGLNAVGMIALQDSGLRRRIENDTNRRDAPIYESLTTAERTEFREGLHTLHS